MRNNSTVKRNDTIWKFKANQHTSNFLCNVFIPNVDWVLSRSIYPSNNFLSFNFLYVLYICLNSMYHFTPDNWSEVIPHMKWLIYHVLKAFWWSETYCMLKKKYFFIIKSGHGATGFGRQPITFCGYTALTILSFCPTILFLFCLYCSRNITSMALLEPLMVPDTFDTF